MMDAQDIFPHSAGFPGAVDDLAGVATDVTELRLVSKVKNIALLRQLARLERLWCFDLNAKSAPIVGGLRSLRRLYVNGIRLPNLGAFAGLISLEVLSLEGCTRVASLDELGPFRSVRALGVEHFPKVHSLDPLRAFTSLTALVVAGGIWTRMTVDSLTPLAALKGLRYLNLGNLKALDGALEPLAALTDLETLVLPNFYSVEEFAKLSARLPTTHCDEFAPSVPLPSVSCPKCGQSSLVMLTGKGTTTVCASCDAVRVKKHEDHFRNIAARAP